MERIKITPRPDWEKKVEELGFGFHHVDGVYWDESAYYKLSLKEIDQIEAATYELWQMCLDAVQHVMDNNLYHKFAIPEYIIPLIIKSWEEDHPSIYGRFDFAVKDGMVKMLEFNADTPTALFEGSVVQWFWLQDCFKDKDQFNSVHEKMVDYWAYLTKFLNPGKLYFSCVTDSLEDLTTIEYMRDCAIQAGLETDLIMIDEIGYDNENNHFIDMQGEQIRNIFKLYPYEWMVREEFGHNLMKDNECLWIEPTWRMILSNKAIMPILSELFPDCEYLLKSSFENNIGDSYVMKPILSREGANIRMFKNGVEIAKTEGEYGEEGYIYQELCELPEFDGNYPVVGSWVIGQEAAGIGIREAETLITNNTSRFIPHLID